MASGIKLSTNFSLNMKIPNFERDMVDVADMNDKKSIDPDFYETGHIIHNIHDNKKYVFDGTKFVQFMEVKNGNIILDCGTF